ncbi:unnamed protein product [Polarella glacialis]|uniref:Uncharacterized protein n=1 Tax=Polarella glacialis TaxID=89957 RepID=A0A813H0L8_POLGL|nr:unnamed protein product [Polarella glacialis]
MASTAPRGSGGRIAVADCNGDQSRGTNLQVTLTSCQAAQETRDGRFSYVVPPRTPYPRLVGFIRRNLFRFFLGCVFLGTSLWVASDWYTLSNDPSERRNAIGLPVKLLRTIKLLSVPVVCLLFTWFHVWLALQMMFYPIAFVGVPGRPIVPRWLGLPINGWQGIVPRKASIMARRACEQMIGNIVTVEEFMDRVQPDHFFESLEGMMGELCSAIVERIMMKRWPTVWSALPSSVKSELKLKVLEDTKQTFGPALLDFRTNINSILDLKEMAIEAFVNDPEMMVDMFRSVATRELKFIQHLAAVMGFLLGLVQVGFYLALENSPGMDYYMLPGSGLIIGYCTNWLALKMTFWPVWPHMMCGGYVNFQGVFLKRQKEASCKMAQLICEKVVDAQAMLNYMLRSPSSTAVVKVLDIYRAHVHRAVDLSVGMASAVAPFVGQQLDEVKQDVVDLSLELLPQHSRAIDQYMDDVMNVEATLSWRLSRIPPPEFEDIIHPIFQDDEWILLLVGAILGVVIGLLQVWALTSV